VDERDRRADLAAPPRRPSGLGRAGWWRAPAAAALVVAVALVVIVEWSCGGSAPPAEPAPFIATIALGMPHTATSDAHLSIPRDVPAIEVQVWLDQRFDRYAMELRDTSNRPVWRADNLHASAERGSLVVAARVPPDALGDGVFDLGVGGGAAPGPLEELGHVRMTVTRTP